MLTGKTFRLDHDTLVVAQMDGKARALNIPLGTIIHVISGSTDRSGMVKVRWEGRILNMFEVDIGERCTEIQDQGASA